MAARRAARRGSLVKADLSACKVSDWVISVCDPNNNNEGRQAIGASQQKVLLETCVTMSLVSRVPMSAIFSFVGPSKYVKRGAQIDDYYDRGICRLFDVSYKKT